MSSQKATAHLESIASKVEDIEARSSSSVIGRIEPFSGTPSEDLTRWLNRFENIVAINNWNAARAAAHLSVNLSGTAELWLYSQPDATRKDYTLLRDALVRAFAPAVGNAFHLRRQVATRRQHPGETVEAFGYAIRNLCNRIDASMKEEEMLTYFVNGLHPSLQDTVIVSGPTTFADALETARRKEYQLLSSTPTPVATVHAIGLQDQSALIAQLEARIRDLEARRAPARPSGQYRSQAPERAAARDPVVRNARTTDGQPICNYCKRVGHIAAMCDHPNSYRNRTGGVSRQNTGPDGRPRPVAVHSVEVEASELEEELFNEHPN